MNSYFHGFYTACCAVAVMAVIVASLAAFLLTMAEFEYATRQPLSLSVFESCCEHNQAPESFPAPHGYIGNGFDETGLDAISGGHQAEGENFGGPGV